MPDTLDLAHRSEIALGGIARTVDPDNDYLIWSEIFWANNPAYMQHNYYDLDLTQKNWEAMAQLRATCGSKEFLDIEQGMEKHLFSCLDKKDGLFYVKYNPKQPWNYEGGYTNYPGVPIKKIDFAAIIPNEFMLYAMVIRNGLGVTPCEDKIRAMVRGLIDIAIIKDDYAYYPDGGKGAIPYARSRSGWPDTNEPTIHGEGPEDGLKAMCIHRVMRSMSLWASQSGDEQALEFAGRLVKFEMKRHFWGNLADPKNVSSADQAHFSRHFGHYLHVLKAMLEYGLAARDSRVLDFVRSGYDYVRTYGISRIGQFSYTDMQNRSLLNPVIFNEVGCILGDMIDFGIKLSRAGLGNYWEDVDRLIRNHMAEAQFLRKDLLERMAQNRPKIELPDNFAPGRICTDNVHERMVGLYNNDMMPTHAGPARYLQCCTGTAGRALSRTWESILENQGDQVQVNLFLNRASMWLDIDSYLPYEGKVVMRNKTAKRISVRIPAWVNRRELRARVNGTDRCLSPFVGGAYQVFDDMKPGDTLQLDFPMAEETVHLIAQSEKDKYTDYKIAFRGNTVVDIGPRNESPDVYPIYLRDHMKTAKKAPMKTKTRFVSNKIIKW